MYIKRHLEEFIRKHLFKGKIMIVYGARQVGKTTLVREVLENQKLPYKYLNCDEFDVKNLLTGAGTSTNLKQVFGDEKIVVIDEAQRVMDIGIKLKLIIDNYPEIQVIATGSSSFDLANEVNEPLTGRNFEFWLYPFSINELRKKFDFFELNRNLESFLIYGMYPAVINANSFEEKEAILKQLTSNYLYKDILKFNNLKSSEIVTKLLQALALQIGNEVSYHELSSLVGASQHLVSSYIDILEKTFIIFRLHPFSRNLRKEIAKSRKIYFYDTGIRNALINNLNPLSLRNDKGALWENFVIAERMKGQAGVAYKSNFYFWRTYDQQEIDLVEEKGGKLFASEIKWQKNKSKTPVAWKNSYPESEWMVVSVENYLEFLK